MSESEERFRIGDLLLDVGLGTLHRGGELLSLAPKSLQLLAELARHYPEVVRRIDLIEAVWADEIISDQTLSQRISLLRRELGDPAGEPTYIGRAWGSGYHLIAPVERLAPVAAGTPARATILILPFDPLGMEGEPGFGEGLAEEVTAGLAAVGELAVMSRTTGMRARLSGLSIREMGQDLGAGFVLEGTVRWSRPPEGGLEGRFTAQLIRTADDTHLWALHLDVPRGSALEAQTALAQRVVLKVRESLAAQATPARPANLAVLDFQVEGPAGADPWLGPWISHALALEARAQGIALPGARSSVLDLLSAPCARSSPPEELARAAGLLGARWLLFGTCSRTACGLRISPRLFDDHSKAIRDLPVQDGPWDSLGFLLTRTVEGVRPELERPAHEGLDRQGAFAAYSQGRRNFYSKGKNALDETLRNFEQALRLDPGFAMAHSGLGSVLALKFIQGTDPACLAKSADHLHKALELDPELTEPFPWLSYVLLRQGDLDDALAMGRKAVQLQPDYSYAHYFLGLAHLARTERDSGGLAEARIHLLNALTVDPTHIPAWICMSWCALMQGDHAEALEAGIRAAALERGAVPVSLFPGNEIFLGQAHLRAGDLSAAERSFRTAAEVMDRTDHAYREVTLGLCFCGLGEVLIRKGDPASALPAFRRAWQLAGEYSSALGSQRLRVLSGAGLASAYALTGAPDKALPMLRGLWGVLEALRPETWVAGAGKAQAAYAFTLAWLRCGEPGAALDSLTSAITWGWRDQVCLARDPVLAPLRDGRDFEALRSSAAGLPTS
jgi:DNA-binding winged helix-turn-helix (wHTH) protein/tetratricopeptide (TPR) repeat protein